MRASREQWRERVKRWKSSGQTAEDFAAAHGFNPSTLRWWRTELNRQARGQRTPSRQPTPSASPRPESLPLIEIRPTTCRVEQRFELELGHGWQLRVPSTFAAPALRRLLGVLKEVA